MDTGRVILGAATAAAIVLAAGFTVVVGQGTTQTLVVDKGGICGTLPAGSTSAAAWFLVPLRNDSDVPVRFDDLRPLDVRGVGLSHLAVAVHPGSTAPTLIVGDDESTAPAEFGRTVLAPRSAAVAPGGVLAVVGRIELRSDSGAGRLRGIVARGSALLGVPVIATNETAFGIRIGRGHPEADIGCPGT